MKTLITTLNSKFIHTSLSLRLLYVATYKKFDIDFKEYTIKDSLEHIRDDIISMNIESVAFSCYIWNIDYILDLCHMLKEAKPDLVIILGGPEVTYDVEHFLSFTDIDFIISGEGEEAFPLLLEAIENHKNIDIEGVSYQGHISKTVNCVDLSYVESLDSPYCLPQDEKNKDKRILYFESSRGCPFQCQYCLSSLEKGLRFFSEDYLKKQLSLICQSSVKTVKFLDRSFNADARHALMILDYIFKHHQKGQQFQFEINADVLHQDIIDFINEKAPAGLLRFEIGIQSTYEPTNKAVKRIQNFQRLSEVVQQLMDGGKCDLHLDLIAGLPYETYERFAKSFDDVFAFQAKELQLGFLKLLRGTSLREDTETFGYIYQEEPPYEMKESKWLTYEDMKKIHIAEDMLEKYWNSGRFVSTMNEIMKREKSPFSFFYQLGCFYECKGYKKVGYQLDELFYYLDTYLNNLDDHERLIQDYLGQFKVKPKRWYEPTLSSKQRKEVIHYLAETYHLSSELLFRYAIVEKLSSGYLVAIYKDYQCMMEIYK
jgi:Fe-S oxidoreductase